MRELFAAKFSSYRLNYTLLTVDATISTSAQGLYLFVGVANKESGANYETLKQITVHVTD